MVAYVESANVAHVLEWRGPGVYRAKCWRQDELRVTDFEGHREDWPVRFLHYQISGDAPAKRWCLLCVKRVQHDVDELITFVLTPAASQ